MVAPQRQKTPKKEEQWVSTYPRNLQELLPCLWNDIVCDDIAVLSKNSYLCLYNSGKRYYKKYVSTYEHQDIKQMKSKEFYCEVCDKQLNGPQPYRAHMSSRGHKEMVEYYEEGENN